MEAIEILFACSLIFSLALVGAVMYLVKHTSNVTKQERAKKERLIQTMMKTIDKQETVLDLYRDLMMH